MNNIILGQSPIPLAQVGNRFFRIVQGPSGYLTPEIWRIVNRVNEGTTDEKIVCEVVGVDYDSVPDSLNRIQRFSPRFKVYPEGNQ